MDHFVFTPKKYFPVFWSTTSFGISGPVYSTIRLPFGISSKANNPNPVLVRRTAYLSFPLLILLILKAYQINKQIIGAS